MTEVSVVIGASRGLGAAIAHELARRDPACPVLATTRGNASTSTTAAAAATTSPPPPNLLPVPGIDIATDACVPALRAAVGDRLIRVLIISAAAMTKDDGSTALADGDHPALAAVAHQFQVNALGPIRVAAALAGRIRPGGKLILVASRTGLPGRIRASRTGGMVGYRSSKAAAQAFGLALAHELAPRGVAVASIHPGTVLTDMYRSWHGLSGSGSGSGGAVEAEAGAGAAGAGAAGAGAAAVIAPRTHAPVTPDAAAARFLDVVDAVGLEAMGGVLDEEGRAME